MWRVLAVVLHLSGIGALMCDPPPINEAPKTGEEKESAIRRLRASFVHGDATVEQVMELAFRSVGPPANAPIKIAIKSKRLAIAASELWIQPDGRIVLHSFSLARFSQSEENLGEPALTAIRGARAYLTLDRPARALPDLYKGTIIGIDVPRGIRIDLSK